MTGAFLILFMADGTQYAFGVFFAALIDELAWSRASRGRRLLRTRAGRELRGPLFAPAGSMAAWGPLAAGNALAVLMRCDPDRVGTYQLAGWLSAGFNVLALILLAFARPPVSRSLA